MRNTLYILLALFAVFTGCRNSYDWKYERMNDFGQNFVNRYGMPDLRQDWNTAAQYTLNVSVVGGGNWNVKVYSGNPVTEVTKSYLLGNFNKDLGQEAEILCDGPYTLQHICIGVENGEVYAMKDIDCKDTKTVAVEFTEEDFVPGSLPEATKMSYIFAFEVADSSKIDYNDIILEVVHVSGESTADVKLRAVGLVYPAYIVYEDETAITEILPEAHNAFGYHNTNIVVNVDTESHNYRSPIVCQDLYVGENFSVVENASRFGVTMPSSEKTIKFSMWPNTEECLGLPSYCILIANPRWDWASEGEWIETNHRHFPAWAREYRVYNSWWDTTWDPLELLLMPDGKTYRPDYDFTDLIYDFNDLKRQRGLKVNDISYERLSPYYDTEIGVNLTFVIVGRNEERIKILLERTDQGDFEWYPKGSDGVSRAYVDVYDKSVNVDAGVGCYAEACHVLITRKTIREIVDNQVNMKVIFENNDTETRINSVWIKAR